MAAGIPHVDSATSEGCSASSDESNGAPRQGKAMAELQPVEVLVQPKCPDVNRAQGECIQELMDGADTGVTDAERAHVTNLLPEVSGILSVSEYDKG